MSIIMLSYSTVIFITQNIFINMGFHLALMQSQVIWHNVLRKTPNNFTAKQNKHLHLGTALEHSFIPNL